KLKNISPNFGAIIGPRNYHELKDVFKDLILGKKHIVKIDGEKISSKIQLQQKRSRKYIAILPIAEGCSGSCSYCCTRFARGRIQSYPATKLSEKLLNFINDGAREILITAEDCSAYRDRTTGYQLPDLLSKFTKKDGGRYFLRVGMMNPKTLRPIIKSLAIVFKHEKIFNFIHIPVQSGSDKILDSMNRGYCRKDFEYIIDYFRKTVKDLMVSTDVICGYPDETDDDFHETTALIEKIRPDILNISMYGHRPNTPASKKKMLPSGVIKARSVKLTKLYNKIKAEQTKAWIGWHGLAIIDEYNAKKKTYVARNSSYRPIILNEGTLGKFVIVKVTGSKSFNLFGEIVEELGEF
ncbi:MAG: MiaB/RimO family radical SAM methylthiotransferase, partial [Promethearchaeota archaeon]